MRVDRSDSTYSLIQREWRLLLTIFFVGVLFYIYPISHQAITIDNEQHIVNGTFNWYLQSKRWGVALIQKAFFLRTFVPSYWIVVNIALLSLATVIAGDLFQYKKEWLKYLFGILVISFPQYSYMMSFACTADAIGVGFVLVTWGLRIFMRSDSWKANLGVLLLFTSALSIYISLIYIPLTIFLILSSSHVVSGLLPPKDWFKQALRIGLITLLSYALYCSISKVLLICYGLPTETPSYFTNMIRWGKDPLGDVIHNILKAIGRHMEGGGYFGEKSFTLVWIPFAYTLFSLHWKDTTVGRKILATILLSAAFISPFIQVILLGHFQDPRIFFSQSFLFASLWALSLQSMPKIKVQSHFLWDWGFST